MEIRIRKLCKNYGEKRALHNFDATFENGIYGMIGNNGAGKSTLLNKLNPELNLDTDDISYSLGRGKHTTRIVELFEFCGGKLMDTPGFSSLDFKDVDKNKIRDSFREFRNFSCPFKDCSHTNEEECGIKREVFANNILKSRYENYLNFIGVDKNES